jgi:hypothetical protein
MNEYIPTLLLEWLVIGHQCVWVHSSADLPGGDLCFYLSYGQIVDQLTRENIKIILLYMRVICLREEGGRRPVG